MVTTIAVSLRVRVDFGKGLRCMSTTQAVKTLVHPYLPDLMASKEIMLAKHTEPFKETWVLLSFNTTTMLAENRLINSTDK